MTAAYLSPPAVAKQFGIDSGKVLGWIHSGQLRAVNVAANAGGRPRWRIATAELENFLARRATPAAPAPRVRRKKPMNVTKYF